MIDSRFGFASSRTHKGCSYISQKRWDAREAHYCQNYTRLLHLFCWLISAAHIIQRRARDTTFQFIDSFFVILRRFGVSAQTVFRVVAYHISTQLLIGCIHIKYLNQECQNVSECEAKPNSPAAMKGNRKNRLCMRNGLNCAEYSENICLRRISHVIIIHLSEPSNVFWYFHKLNPIFVHNAQLQFYQSRKKN